MTYVAAELAEPALDLRIVDDAAQVGALRRERNRLTTLRITPVVKVATRVQPAR